MDSWRRNCVSPVFLKRWVWSLVLTAFFSLVIPVFPVTFVFDSFNGTNLILKADASYIQSQSVIALTKHSLMFGQALYSIPVQMKRNETFSSFSTTFVFRMVRPHSDAGGDGMAFFLTPYTSPMGVLPAQYLGLLNLTSNGQEYNHLFAVEFDTNRNMEFHDPNDNHVGVDINSLSSVENENAGYWNGEEFHGFSLTSGRNIQAWIDYDHLQSCLNVTITLAGLPRPQKPLISRKISLQSVLQENMFVGFSAGSCNFLEYHQVLAWSFTTEGRAPPLDISHLPSVANHSRWGFIASVTVATLVTLVLLSLAVATVFLKRAKYGEKIEEWEQEFWPHRFTYRELNIATNGFRDENVLGEGGFGRVYRGVLPGSGQEVAVKSITKEFTEGMKGFVAEISTMGRMQHRNLVPLRGWCRMQKQLFIVYDYMLNGSLDKLIFGNPATVLPWPRRYAILKGVAAGLLYLHEQWEKRVIHRDIKLSNVLLDSELNGRLGDFGLAQLYEHSENLETTIVVGTPGYIAPEIVHTGKPTPSSDVFSFGVLLLEVACGRKSVDLSTDAEQQFLVDWVGELSAHESAADPKLGNEYDAGEMEKVLKLGLLCSITEPKRRLGIRQVCQILEGEAPLPDVHLDQSSVGVNGWVVTADPADRLLQQIPSGSRSNGLLVGHDDKKCRKLCQYSFESSSFGFYSEGKVSKSQIL